MISSDDVSRLSDALIKVQGVKGRNLLTRCQKSRQVAAKNLAQSLVSRCWAVDSKLNAGRIFGISIDIQLDVIVYAKGLVGNVFEVSNVNDGRGNLDKGLDGIVRAKIVRNYTPGRQLALAIHVRVRGLGIGVIVNAHDLVLRILVLLIFVLDEDRIGGIPDNKSSHHPAVRENEAVGSAKGIIIRVQAGSTADTEYNCQNEFACGVHFEEITIHL